MHVLRIIHYEVVRRQLFKCKAAEHIIKLFETYSLLIPYTEHLDLEQTEKIQYCFYTPQSL